MTFFEFKKGEFLYDPYPIGLAQNIIKALPYNDLVTNFPSRDLFIYRPNYGKKWSLSETDNSQAYFDFIKNNSTYFNFYKELKDKEFILKVVDFLKSHKIEVPLRNRKFINTNKFSKLYFFNKTYLHILNKLGSAYHLNARFEFSRMPVDGGHILPHTDSPQKIITIVVPIVSSNDGTSIKNAGTSVLRPKDVTNNYNQLNKWLSFDDVELVKTFPFEANKSIVFVKTFNSLHGVAPLLSEDKNQDRKSLTINIEFVQKHYGSRTF